MQENSYILNSKKNKNTNILYIIKFIIFLLFIIPSIICVGNKYKKINSLNQINAYNKRRFDIFYGLPKNTLDLVFIGSSHSYCTFDPAFFDYKLNINSFQMGMPLQHPDSSYYTLLEILNYQIPSKVVMEVYWNMLVNDFELRQIDMFFQVLKNDSLKKDFFKNVFPINEKIKYIIPIIRFQQDYFSYKNKQLINKIENYFEIKQDLPIIEGTEYVTDKGFLYSNYVIPKDLYNEKNQFNNFNGDDWQFSLVQKVYLEKIITLCKKNNIKLYFVTAPIAPISLKKINNYNNINKKISDFANEYNIPYIDYNLIKKDIPMLLNKNFRDDAHLNYSGSLIINEHFADWLLKFN